ncbi:MAG: RnfABCDGE type electron transport complex subunit B [Pseudomonadota bacterium]
MLPSIIILGGLGLLFGVGLYIASKLFHVPIDPRVSKVESALPGANCGACGLAGCGGFARAIVHGSADIAGCLPGGEDVVHAVAAIMGVEAVAVEKNVAVLMCQGRNVKERFEYTGIKTCRTASLIHNGPRECLYGCVGYGDCASICPFDALHMVDGWPVVDEQKCTACGKCVVVCPKDLFSLHGIKSFVHVRCKSLDSGKVTRKACSLGCIGCKRCEKECPFDAVHVIDNLAVFDYEKCTSCGKCVNVCPTKTITNERSSRKELGIFPLKKENV